MTQLADIIGTIMLMIESSTGRKPQTLTTPPSRHPTTYIELSTGERIEVQSGRRYVLLPAEWLEATE